MDIRRSNTILYCTDWELTVAFYRDVLGLPATAHTDWFVEFQLNAGATLSVADASRTTVSPGGGAGITISLAVADVDRTRAELESRGVTPGPIRSVWGSRAFFAFDPEGHRLEFWS
ncbi:MAG: VOC family protein [Spirochaeta sp.]|jgi:catechol 2,3-dioxygenase-like lactoylglutathione lyase family enzyme|nr:VOC family protein [Spirochaeta sp.]